MRRLHDSLCCSRAFPNTLSEHRDAHEQLLAFGQRAGKKIPDNGIVGTRLHYRFSFHVAKWLARKAPGAVCIDWSEYDECERLDELLQQILQSSEDDYFDSGYVSSQEWIALASAGFPGTDFDWLLAQLQDKRLQKVWSQLYDAADLPLVWDTGESALSKSRNVFPVKVVAVRAGGIAWSSR